ncbi:phosphotransferase [Psychromonas aquimarina]|uniref:phosphotransferase n=1 Tax=Psychromonas aquimarina TaxID=444919 RepID=UPI00146F9E42|nr:phosphotransferase [Psychromonas aquimarina]
MLNITTDELSWFSELKIGRLLKSEQITHALTNQVFLLTFENNLQYIFKRLNLKARSVEDRKRELAVQKTAAEKGLTAKVIAVCDAYKLQEYIPGQVLSHALVKQNILELLARQLQRIHQLPAGSAQPQQLVYELNLLKKQLNKPVDNNKFAQMLRLADRLDKSSSRDILCHGDLSVNNVLISDQQQIMILDWEYAVTACAAYDLAFCSCINEFNAAQREQLIEHYYCLNQENLTQSLKQLKDECALYFTVFVYINELWALCFLPE